MSDTVQQELGRSTPITSGSFPGRPVKPAVPAANLTYAYAGFGAVLGVLFGVATAVTLHQNTQTTAQVKTIVEPPIVISDDAGVVRAGFTSPEMKDMGSVSSLRSGLRGHLTTSWSDGLSYHLVVSPTDPAQNDAFAQTVNNPPRPLSINLQLKSATGQVLCNQQVAVKYDPSKTTRIATAQLSRLDAIEADREQSGDVFQSDLGKDGKLNSISSEGTIPCSKQDYEATAYWTFTPQFPDVREQAQLLKHGNAGQLDARDEARAIAPKSNAVLHLAVAHPAVVAARLASEPKLIPTLKTNVESQTVKTIAPAMPSAAPKSDLAVADVQAPAVFHFEIEGDDEIVDFDANQKSLETSAGKTFYVSENLTPGNVASWLDEQADVHYRCDEKSSCTLSLASASTVLHATMRSHHATLAEVTLPAPAGASGPGNGSVDLVELGR
jgi:hypothetical protein